MSTKTKIALNIPYSPEQMAKLREYRPKDVGRAFERAIDLGLILADTPLPFLEVIGRVASKNCWKWTPSPAWPQDREYYNVRVSEQLASDAQAMAQERGITLSDMLAIAMSYGVSCYKARKAMLSEMLCVNPKRKRIRGLLPDGVTYAGQAYFAGTGPAAICADCKHYRPRHSPFTGKELRGECQIYMNIMELINAPKFPRSAKACKEFQDKP